MTAGEQVRRRLVSVAARGDLLLFRGHAALDRVAAALPLIEAAEESGDVLDSCLFELQRRTVETVDLARRLAHLEEISGDIEKREAKQRQGHWDEDDEDNGRCYTEAELGAPLDTLHDGGDASSRSGA